MLSRCGVGFGALGLATVMGEAGLLAPAPVAAAELTHPLAPRFPQFAAKAKRVVHFFLNGGPSQVDSFDPKPALEKYAGKPMPGGNLPTERKTGGALPSPFKFATPRQGWRSATCSPSSASVPMTCAWFARCAPRCPTMSLRSCS